LSRSWNRVYAQIGLERAGWTVLGRVWRRINEAAANDYSALLRRNFSTERGAVQLSWAFPLAGHIKGYAHLFSGYG
jgi:phospholipase A1